MIDKQYIYKKISACKHFACVSLVFLVCLLLSGCQVLPHLGQMIKNLMLNFQSFYGFTIAAANLIGFTFIARAIYQLKVYGDLRNMMSVQTNFKSTMILLLAGTALLYTTNSIESMAMTFFATTTPDEMSYAPSQSGLSVAGIPAILSFIRLIGTISFVRGWMHLAQSSNPNGRSSFGKAVTHIVSGIFAMNIQRTADLLAASIGN